MKTATTATMLLLLICLNFALFRYLFGLSVILESWPGFLGGIIAIGTGTRQLTALCAVLALLNMLRNLYLILYMAYNRKCATWKQFLPSVRCTLFIATVFALAYPFLITLNELEWLAKTNRFNFADVERESGLFLRGCAEVFLEAQKVDYWGLRIAIAIIFISITTLISLEQSVRFLGGHLIKLRDVIGPLTKRKLG